MKIIITGASEGIGKTMALAFAKRGASLALFARRQDLLNQVALECKKLGSPVVHIEAVDITQSQAFREGLEKSFQSMGGITHFIANAGMSGRSHPKKDSWHEVKKCLELNVMATFDGIEWVKAKMVQQGSGVIVGVSSVAGTRGLPDSGAYSASKSALTKYLESLRLDLAPYHVDVLTIAPGFIDTPLTKANKGKMLFLMDATEAGEIFAKEILQKKRLIVAPWQYRYIMMFLRWMPDPIYDLLMRLVMIRIRGKKAA